MSNNAFQVKGRNRKNNFSQSGGDIQEEREDEGEVLS